jgi:hypothetical protein
VPDFFGTFRDLIMDRCRLICHSCSFALVLGANFKLTITPYTASPFLYC